MPDSLPDDDNETTSRIIAAARAEFEQYGVRRANVEQVARRAGVSRVTVYRHFAGKDELARAVVARDIRDFTASFDAVWERDAAIDERVADAFVLVLRAVRKNPMFNSLLRSEPEVLLPLLTIDGESMFAIACELLEARLQHDVKAGLLPDVDVPLLAELLVRLVHSIVLLPFGAIPAQTDAEVRALARTAVATLVLTVAPR